LVAGEAVWRFSLRHRGKNLRFGVSFSVKFARQLGVDPRQNYLALLDELGVRRFRLMSYWDEIEKQPEQYDFNELDFEMNEAAKRGAKVTLATGLRQPRYPECFMPEWAKTLPLAEQYQRLDRYLTVVTERYRWHPALESLQLENEALNTVFGVCAHFSRAQLVSEFNLIKRLDPRHPVIVNVSNEFGLPLRAPRGDKIGFSVYRRLYDQTITHTYVNYFFFPALWHRVRAALIERYLHRTVFIHELQGEPWGPAGTEQLSLAEQNKSMDAARLLKVADYARRTGIKDIYWWGGEWWYWRKVKFNDPAPWESARIIFGANFSR
jgi:hypothetical protein